jgi:hypothetical protein
MSCTRFSGYGESLNVHAFQWPLPMDETITFICFPNRVPYLLEQEEMQSSYISLQPCNE